MFALFPFVYTHIQLITQYQESQLLSLKTHIFGAYSFLENIVYMLLEGAPQPIRNLVFKLAFKRFGRGCMLDYKTYFRYPWVISIGDGVSINRGCAFFGSYVAGGAEIVIGNNVAIGPSVKIFSASHEYSTRDLNDTAGDVVIGDGAWIGGASIILPCVEIGEGAVIGAGSIVSRSIPPYSVAVGNPAQVIRERVIADESPIQ